MSRTRQLFLLALFGLAFGESEKQRTGNVCKIDMECPDNAFCRQNSYCVCKDGYVYSAINATNKGCLKEAHHGESCVQNIQCHSTLGLRSECINGICACNPSAHLEDDRCYDTAFIGERCIVPQNCYLGDRSQVENQAFCVRGYCVCGLQYSPRDNGTRCVKDAGLGEQCEDQLQCAGVGLICRGSCRCKDNWIANNDTKSCVESVEALDGPCEYDVQCDALSGAVDAPAPGAAVCMGGRCSCAYSAHAAGTPARCWHRRWPGQACRRDEECVAEMDQKAYCRAGRCTCDTCSPDANDFDGANSLSCPMKLIAAILIVAAILKH